MGVDPSAALEYTWIACLLMQLLRGWLILRIANTFVGLRVMLLVFTKNIVELLTIVSLLAIGMMVFAILIFAAEIGVDGGFYTAWEGCWWAVITMTTVGYGDMYPHNWPGYIIGACCAVTGIMITAMSIPIVSSNFNVYYNHVTLATAHIKRRVKELRAKHGSQVENFPGPVAL
ncbi:potassium voltage-gated channel subfamily C member 1-like [Lineus longissimus]|uniref:potassium voltage-gated channel subfamily C member 1-like n=1 Tax=Lineus longissimus TaxID=88925 RepID=UPI00315C4C14